jgi:thiamine transport system ATP-binding protein
LATAVLRLDHAVYDSQGFRLEADFTVVKGSFVAVLGPSGAGKTTLLNMIAGFDPLSSGRVLIGKDDITHLPPATRPVSLVFQDHNSFAHLDAWSNVALGASPSLKLDVAQRTKVDEALTAVGLAELARRKPGDMSGGERQRIAIARVLVRNHPVLLLDEAFAALGPALRREMLSLVKYLHTKRKLSTLMVTHQPEDARAFADSVIFVDKGLARAPIVTAEFFASRDKDVRAYLGAWT